MSIRLLYGIVIVVFVSGVFLVGRSAYKIYTRKNLTQDGYVSAELKRVRTEDLQTLIEANGSEEQISKSLLRYTSQNLPESEELIKKYLQTNSETVHAAAIESSGAYEWADLKVFADALSDKAENMRLAALRGLAKRTDSARIELVKRHVLKKSLSEREWLTAQLTLLKLDGDPTAKEVIRNDILSRMSSWEVSLQTDAYTELMRALPNDEEIKMAIRNELPNPEFPVAAQGIQYLAAFDREWVMEKFSSLPMRNDYLYQLVSIDLMSALCPEGWKNAADAIAASPAAPDVPKHLDDAQLGIKCRLGL